MNTVGSSKLTPEDQEEYLRRFGVRYTHVQWQPGTANRYERRQRKFRPRMNADRLAELETRGLAVKRGKEQR